MSICPKFHGHLLYTLLLKHFNKKLICQPRGDDREKLIGLPKPLALMIWGT